MGEESNLEQLTERVAEQIIFVVGSASGDPKAAVMRLLQQYLADAQEQAYEEALREQIQVMGAWLIAHLHPWRTSGRSVALDSTHKKHRGRGEIPHSSIPRDTQRVASERAFPS